MASTMTSLNTAFSAASGASAASTRREQGLLNCAGSGRCTPNKPGALRTDNHAGTLDEAKAEFEASWEKWKAWAGLEEAPNPPRSAG